MDKCIRKTCNRTSGTSQGRNNANNGCDTMKKRLYEVEFAITETVLYLDAYPGSTQAMEHYQRLRDERELLLQSINTQCGPLTHYDNISNESWLWGNDPWPWKYEAN